MPVTSEGPVILAAFANDRSDQTRFLRNLSEEAQRIQAVLSPAQSLCPLVLLPSATLDEILTAFQTYRDRIVVFHYAGHANGFQLLLESSSGGVHRVGAKGLAAFLGQQQGLQLVFLNGCSTERQAEDLLNAGVGCVIATTQAIDDGVATDFSARFYKGIVTGAPLQSAYSEAVGSAQAASGGSIDRLLVPVDGEEEVAHDAGRWPWLLKFKPGAERVAQWSLPEAAGDPLFGLPPVPQRDLPESPYRHLYRFEAEHAEVFFGRGHEIRELYQRVTASDAAPVVLFYGPSGVGKSSLLDAGLIPRLTGKNEVRYVRRDPALGLGETLRSAFSKEARQLSRRDAWIATEKQLGRPLVIVLDQVEEVFTKPNTSQPHELAEFAQLLRRIFSAPDHRPQGRLILGFRKEWFAEIDELLADAQVPRSRIFLERLSRDGAIAAITGPVDDLRLTSQYQLKIEDGLPEVIADDLLADPDTPVAPTLQILLTRMWSEACRRNREHPTFDAELYQSLHRNGILLDDFLRQQTAQIRERLPRAVNSGFLLDLLEFHTTAIGTSAEHPLSVLETVYAEQAKSGWLSETLALCEELYLLTFSGTATSAQPPHSGPLPPSHIPLEPPIARGGEGAETPRSSRLLHDTLAPLIRARHEESDLPGQRSRRILDNRIVDWLDGKTGIPLDAKDLKEVEAALEGTRSWSADEQRLVTASREQRSSNRRWRQIFKGLGVAAVVVIANAGGFAYVQWGEAVAQRKVADGKTILANQETAKAQLAQADADKQAAKAREELAKSERTLAVTDRDIKDESISSAHHFANAAFALSGQDQRQQERMTFAAGRSINGLTLSATMETSGPTHEAWLLDDGSLCAITGIINQDEMVYFEHQLSSGTTMDYLVPIDVPETYQRAYVSELENRIVVVSSKEFSPHALNATNRGNDKFINTGDTRVSLDTQFAVTGGATGATVINLASGESEVLTPSAVDVVRISDTGQSILTWRKQQSPVLWRRNVDGSLGWNSLPLDSLGSIDPEPNLSSEFLPGEEAVLIWTVEREAGTGRDLAAKGYHVEGTTGAAILVECRFPEKDLRSPEIVYQGGRRGWSFAASQSPLKNSSKPGKSFCLWDSSSQQIWAWRLSGSVADSTTIVPNPTFTTLPFNGLAMSPNSLFAIWTGEGASRLQLGRLKQFNPSDLQVMEFPHTRNIQEVRFSQDGSKMLVWTAEEAPVFRQKAGGGANRSGSVRIWETASGMPLTSPVKYPSALRGAKWVDHDQGFIVWGEDHFVQHWKIAETSPVQSKVEGPESEHVSGNLAVARDGVHEVETHGFPVVGIRYLKELGKPVNPISRSRKVRGVRFIDEGQTVLEWGGNNGVGYAAIWKIDNLTVFSQTFPHTDTVGNAEVNSNGDLLLSTTEPQYHDGSFIVHLWDMTAKCELIEPWRVLSGGSPRFGPEDVLIDFPTGNGVLRHHIAPRPPLLSIDPRWEVMQRTGTFMDQTGALSYFTNKEFRQLTQFLRDTDPLKLPPLEKWLDELIKARDVIPKATS